MQGDDLNEKRILVVDPDPHARRASLEQLERVGLKAVGAKDFYELQRELEHCDLVVTDWGVGPGPGEGLPYLAQLHAWKRPVLLYSALPDGPDRSAAGLRHYIRKPDLTLLLKTIAMELISPVPERMQGAGPTLLIIEDSPTIRRYLCGLFERELPGCRLVEAADGRAALNEMTRTRADLIVSDLQMPGMDGRSFIAKLRSNALLRKKCVLVLSGDDLQDLLTLYKDDAGIRFLAKPSKAEDIVGAAMALLAAANASLEARP